MCDHILLLSCHLCLFFPPFFFFNATATTEIYTLSLHDALPISAENAHLNLQTIHMSGKEVYKQAVIAMLAAASIAMTDRKSTRLNSSHQIISYAVFCLKKKKKNNTTKSTDIATRNTRYHTKCHT